MNSRESVYLMTRRKFTGSAASLLIFLLTMTSSVFMWGCSVFTDILNWVPVGQAALNSILSILTGNGILISPQLQVIIGLINAGFTALIAAIKEYESTTPPPVGALAKIETVLHDIVDNFSTFLESLKVSGGLLSLITSLAQVVLSTIAAFMNQLPASPAGKKVVLDKIAQARVAGQPFSVKPQHRTKSQFKKDWNATLATGAKAGVKCPPEAYLHVSLLEHL